MKVLIAPLNWGLGHASRCLPLIVRYLRNGDDVVLAGDGESLTLLRKHFPNLPYYTLAPLNLRYSSGSSQIWAMTKALPQLAWFIRADHQCLKDILRKENIDLIISDNRFGLYSSTTRCVYITHQLMIKMPQSLRRFEGLAHRLHLRYINKYDECWIPDSEGTDNLSGDLSHLYPLPANAHFIGPLSRFEYIQPLESSEESFDAIAVLSGLEPQRTLLEKDIIRQYAESEARLLLVRGKMNEPKVTIHKKNITIVPYISDAEMSWHLQHTPTIISRSGYSSIMDYASLGLFEKAKQRQVELRLIATPGQPEQEYLASLHKK